MPMHSVVSPSLNLVGLIQKTYLTVKHDSYHGQIYEDCFDQKMSQWESTREDEVCGQ